jgi:hypothetical protein
MPEPSKQVRRGKYDFIPLTAIQARQLDKLQNAACEENPICQQAPVIWDAENAEDAKYAKRNCLGIVDRGETKQDPCPLVELCLETALVINVTYGVWGGTTPFERKQMRYNKS